tara:strand:- start:269 stop:490 length:222 start_codon:yes stop_codon:yes gene_type:complete
MKILTTVDIIADLLVLEEGQLVSADEAMRLTLEVIDDVELILGTDGGPDMYRISLKELGLQRIPEEMSNETRS